MPRTKFCQKDLSEVLIDIKKKINWLEKMDTYDSSDIERLKQQFNRTRTRLNTLSILGYAIEEILTNKGSEKGKEEIDNFLEEVESYFEDTSKLVEDIESECDNIISYMERLRNLLVELEIQFLNNIEASNGVLILMAEQDDLLQDEEESYVNKDDFNNTLYESVDPIDEWRSSGI